MPKKKPELSFDQSISELEILIQAMESGDLNLEASLEAFEKGITLTKTCKKKLQDAKQKVEILIEENGQIHSIPFNEIKI